MFRNHRLWRGTAPLLLDSGQCLVVTIGPPCLRWALSFLAGLPLSFLAYSTFVPIYKWHAEREVPETLPHILHVPSHRKSQVHGGAVVSGRLVHGRHESIRVIA